MGEEANVHRVAIGLQPFYLNCRAVIHFECASPVAHVARRQLTAHIVHYHIIIILYQHLISVE